MKRQQPQRLLVRLRRAPACNCFHPGYGASASPHLNSAPASARSMPLAGAFAAGGVGLKESKQEKRERLELAELQAFVSAPAWASEDLLLELRKHGKASCALEPEWQEFLESPNQGTASAAAAQQPENETTPPKRPRTLSEPTRPPPLAHRARLYRDTKARTVSTPRPWRC